MVLLRLLQEALEELGVEVCVIVCEVADPSAVTQR